MREFGKCIINKKYEIPFDNISQMVNDPKTGQKTLTCTIQDLDAADKAAVESAISPEVLQLIGQTQGIVSLRFINAKGELVLETHDYSFFQNLTFTYQAIVGSWQFFFYFQNFNIEA